MAIKRNPKIKFDDFKFVKNDGYGDKIILKKIFSSKKINLEIVVKVSYYPADKTAYLYVTPSDTFDAIIFGTDALLEASKFCSLLGIQEDDYNNITIDPSTVQPVAEEYLKSIRSK